MEASGKIQPPDRRKRSGFMASRHHPLIYGNIPKSGCTTIKNLLHRLDSGTYLEDPLTIHNRKDLLLRAPIATDEIFDRLYTDIVFTFVRHPLRRAYSSFNEKIYNHGKYSFPWARKILWKHHGITFSHVPSLEEHRSNFMTFLRLVGNANAGKNPRWNNPHWKPQATVIRNSTRWRMFDFIGRVEQLNTHLSMVLSLVGLENDHDIPRMNEGPPPPYKYEDIIDDAVLALGQDVYADDFRLFGYTPYNY